MVRKINSNKFGVIEYAIDTEEDLEKLPRKETDNTVYAILSKNGKRLIYLYSKELKDYILINGDLEGINVELENINEQLDNITKDVYVSDKTVGNNILPFQFFPLEYLRAKQNSLYATFMRNLRKGVAQKVCCQGDSLTYGHDVVSSDKRPSVGDIAPDGSTSTTTIASITYPEALENCLKRIYPNISVINRGRSGSYTKHGYELWSAPSNSNLTIMMYGTNDSRASWVDYKGNIEEYLKWYEKLIAREILRDSAVIILTPPRETENDLDVDTFSQSLFLLGEKYGVPVIKTDEMLSNYGSDIFSDEVHFNGKGYNIFGSRIASLLIGEGCKTPQYVSDGSKINPLPTIYNYSKNGDITLGKSTATWPTAQGVTFGINNGAISFSFYSEVDDLLVYPSVYARGTVNFKIELDFGIVQGSYTNSQIIDKGDKGVTEIAPSVLNESVINTYPYYNRYKTPSKFIHIVNKGWHTITITNNGNSDNNVIFYGLEFINFNTNKALNLIKPLEVKIPNAVNNFVINDGAYYKNLQGEVTLQGKLTTISKAQIFILEAGFRPATTSRYYVVPAKKSDNTYTIAVVSIYASGGVYVESDATDITTIWLDGISFKTV